MIITQAELNRLQQELVTTLLEAPDDAAVRRACIELAHVVGVVRHHLSRDVRNFHVPNAHWIQMYDDLLSEAAYIYRATV